MPELAGKYPDRSLAGRRTVPVSGAITPARHLSRVVLPAPSPPTTAVTWPAGAASDTPASAAVLPYRTQSSVAPQAAWPASAAVMLPPPAGPGPRSGRRDARRARDRTGPDSAGTEASRR